MYMFLPRSAAKSLYLWSSPILSGCSGRHPQSKPQLPIFPPQGSFTGRSLGDHLAIFLLQHPLIITSHGGSLAWGGGWYTCPMYDGCPYTREHQLLMQQEEAGFGGGLMTVHVGLLFVRGYISHDLSYHFPSLFLPTYP